MTDSLPDPAGTGSAPPLKRGRERFDLLVDSVVDYAIFMLDPEGRVLTWNIGAQRLKGYPADEIIGSSFMRFYPPEAVAAGWPQEELRRATAEGRFEDEGWRIRKDGSRFWANVVITALRGDDGSLQGFAKVTRDLSERRRQEETLRHSEEQFRLLLESVSDYGIFMLDPKGHVLTWNAGAQALLGYAAHEVLHRHFSMFFTPQDIAAGTPARELAAAVLENRAAREGWRVGKDGNMFWASVVITPVRRGDGELRGFAKVTRDLSEQRRLNELELTSRHMSEFLAMLGHELRNPLAPIRNAVSVMQMQSDLPPLLQRTRDIVDRQLEQLTRLVDDLLDVGRIVTGKIVLRSTPIDYRDVVLASLEVARPLIEERKHRLEVDLPDGPIAIAGDAARLNQSLQNLLNNAARYTPEGGQIALSVRVEGSTCTTTVTDNGRGIAPGAAERIFALFAQEDDARMPSDGGLGIGLALARTLVEAHGGTLSVHSEGLGRGSTFTMMLPRRDDPLDAAARAAAAPATPVVTVRRVLVVDDNRDSAETMVYVLDLLGQDARAAYSAAEAIRVAREFEPEIVLLDLNLPDGDGFSVMSRLREQSAQPLHIAAMTGYGQESDRTSTLQAGFQAHLTKPVGIDGLLQMLGEAGAASGR